MKIFNNYLFRVMSTWFAQYVQLKVQAAIAYVFSKAVFIYVKTTENAQTILNFFNTHDLYVGDAVYRYIGEVEEGPVALYDQKFGLLNGDFTVSPDVVVYGDRRDYDDLQDGDKVYDAEGVEMTVSNTELPTEGYVNLTGFDDPLHVVSGVTYGN